MRLQHHASFIPAAVRGLTASPGSFAFREVDLGAGGRIVAQATVHGRPLADAVCEVHALTPDAPDPRAPYRLLWEGRVDGQGVCRSSHLAQGEYKVRVRTGQGAAQVNRWVTVVEAQDTEVDLSLAPTRVSGEVRRGNQPAPGYSVEAMLIDLDRPQGARGDVADTAVSDEDGRYELTLWAPGWYSLHLRSPARTPAAGHQESRKKRRARIGPWRLRAVPRRSLLREHHRRWPPTRLPDLGRPSGAPDDRLAGDPSRFSQAGKAVMKLVLLRR